MASHFIFSTDDSCDLPQAFLEEQGIRVIPLSYTIDDRQYKGWDQTPEEFYALVRQGKMPITAQVNREEARDYFLSMLREGQDIFHLAFSSGLSGTYASVRMAAESLRADFPDRRIVVVDSLAASMGQGLLVYKLNELYHAGAAIDELAKYAEDTRDHIVHSFTVNDLMHLHRGGRVSRASAIAGSMLGIKPVLHVDYQGKLINIDKVRGRKQALTRVVDNAEKWNEGAENDIFMVSHGDCPEDAQFVADLVKQRMGIGRYMINQIGAVIGSHAGPGTIALFLLGNKFKG